MNLDFSHDELAFRDEVQAFLADKLTPRFADAGRNCSGIYCKLPLAQDWFRILAEKGWSVPHWPVVFVVRTFGTTRVWRLAV